ncbi:MAG: cytidylyltransferase domain-containing protein [Candidatus Asgardarchaeia archaeon]
MKDINDVFFFIQARLNSERVPNKMLRPFAETTLMDIAINKILSSELIPKDNFYLCVGDKKLIELGEKYILNIFKRSHKSINEEYNLKSLFEWYEFAKDRYKYAVMINACCPFLTVNTVEEFVKTYLENEQDGLFSVIKKKNFFMDKEGIMLNSWSSETEFTNTKLVEPLYEAAHCIGASSIKSIENNIWLGTFKKPNDPVMFEVKEEESLDIDYEWQFKLLESYYKREKNIY